MAELRIWDRSSTFYKSLYTKEAKNDIDLYFPNKSGMILSDGTLSKFIVDAGNLKDPQIFQPDEDNHQQVGTYGDDGSFYGPLKIADYNTAETFIGNLDTTEWVCARDIDFTDIVDTTSDPEFREEWMPDSIEAGVTYYIKYRFISSDVVSEWSKPITIKFRTRGYAVPKLTIIENGEQPIFKASPNIPFGPDGHPVYTYPHVSTSWIIKNRRDNTIVHQSLKNTTDLYTYNTPPNVLSTFEQYKIIVIYHFNTTDATLKETRKAIGYFELNDVIQAPTLVFKQDNGDYRVEASEFVSVSNIPEVHQFTHWTVKNNTGAVIYDNPFSTSLRVLHLLNIDGLQHNNIYTVECKFIGAKATSATNRITVVIPPLSVSAAGNLKLEPLANGDLKATFTSRIDTGLPLYLSLVISDSNTGTVIYNKLDNDVEPYGQNDISYTISKDIISNYLLGKYINKDGKSNLNVNLLGVGKIITDKGEYDYASVNLGNYFSFNMPTITMTSTNLKPTFILGNYTASHNWITVSKLAWVLVKKGVSRDTVPLASGESTTDIKNIACNITLETSTQYDIYVDYYTTIGIYTKCYTFTTPSYTFANPTVTLVGAGLYKTVRASNYNLSNYSGVGAEHYATTWTIYAQDGSIIYTSGKNTSNLTSFTLTSNIATLEYNTVYKIGVIFHSKSGLNSPETRVDYFCKPYIVDVGTIAIANVNNVLQVPINNVTFTVDGGLVHEEGSTVSLEQVTTAIWEVKKSTGETVLRRTITSSLYSYTSEVTFEPLTNYTVTVTLISENGFESEPSTLVFRTEDPSIHNIIKLTPKIDLDTTGVYTTTLSLVIADGPVHTRLNTINVKWGNETKSVSPLTNTGASEFVFEDALINNPITISLHYGNMVKSIIMYTTSSMAGEDTTILDGTEVVGINQAIVDFQASNDSVIKIQ